MRELGELLDARGERAELVVIGGGALLLLGLGARVTEDCGVVAVIEGADLRTSKPLPAAIADAALAVARARGLADDWLNPGPTDLLRHGLPDGFMDRAHRRDYGPLTLFIADRFDQIHLKLFATSGPDDKHARDLRALRPTREELERAAAWAHARSAGGHSDEIAQAVASFAPEANGHD